MMPMTTMLAHGETIPKRRQRGEEFQITLVSPSPSAAFPQFPLSHCHTPWMIDQTCHCRNTPRPTTSSLLPASNDPISRLQVQPPPLSTETTRTLFQTVSSWNTTCKPPIGRAARLSLTPLLVFQNIFSFLVFILSYCNLLSIICKFESHAPHISWSNCPKQCVFEPMQTINIAVTSFFWPFC